MLVEIVGTDGEEVSAASSATIGVIIRRAETDLQCRSDRIQIRVGQDNALGLGVRQPWNRAPGQLVISRAARADAVAGRLASLISRQTAVGLGRSG